MRTRIRAGRVALLVFALTAPAAGCHTLQPSTPLTVHVRDAETQAPVPGATVRLWRFGSHAEDREQSYTTGADGDAVAHLAPPDEGGVMVGVTSPDYLTNQTTLPNELVDALSSAKPFHPYKGAPLVFTFDVYKGPRPTAELVIPTGFRGLIKAEVRVVPNGSWPAGQRVFSYTVPPTGVVDVSGPQIFNLAGVGPDFVAKLEDGTLLPKNPPKGEDVGLRWVIRKGPTTYYYVVGTAADLAAQRSVLGHDSSYSEGETKKSSGRGGGGGGGGGMGGRGMGGMGGRGGGGGMGGMGGSGGP